MNRVEDAVRAWGFDLNSDGEMEEEEEEESMVRWSRVRGRGDGR